MSTAPLDLAHDASVEGSIITRSDARADLNYADDKNAIVRREIDRIARQLDGMSRRLRQLREQVKEVA